MRAIVIDPWQRNIYATDKPQWDLDEMYQTLSGPEGFRKCDDINSIRLGRSVLLWVDGEGALIPDVPVWNLRGYPAPLVGMGLILGITQAGDNMETILDVEWVRSMVTWTTQVTSGDLGPIESGPGYVKIGDPILRERGE